MKRLEGEVLDTLDDLGLADPKLAFEGETVTPRQFFGLDLNERAVAIADLVLWLGHIKWQLRTTGLDGISDPVLEKLGNIRHQDAILAYDNKTLARDDDGNPITRWNGYSYKAHPITGKDIPDPEARVEGYNYENPKRAVWPEAEFIVGNPPFIGGKDMRAELGDGYAEAAWKARPKIPGGADFVMHFWDEAAQRLARKPTKAKPNPLRRFGFITTNSITQTFSRRVVEAALSAKSPISLVFAVADHPWMKAVDKAAVRISMTVAERGELDGALGMTVNEENLTSDTPEVVIKMESGKITPRLTIGADVSRTSSLLANQDMASPGVKLHGSGFIISEQTANIFYQKNDSSKHRPIRKYRNGRDITQRPRDVSVIDLYGLSSTEAQRDYPKIYQHLLTEVKPVRDQNNRETYRKNWWIFGEPRSALRPVLEQLGRYIATVETAKHRFFVFLDKEILPDNMVIAIGSDNDAKLATLSSRIHVCWMLATGGTLEDRPRYNKSKTFDPFPFPVSGNSCFIDKPGSKLDTHRKTVIEQHDFLTMTGIYNVLERVRELDAGIGDPLSDSEKNVYDAALIGILKEIHDDIDRATLEAYGWSDLAPALVGKVGATLPSPHKSAEQEAAEEELLTRLVALNIERREEEQAGHVRWLRPDYQIPKLGHKVKAETKDMDVAPVLVDDAPAWPKDGLDQIKVVRELLFRSDAPVLSDAVSGSFKGRNTSKRKTRVLDVLETLVATGIVRKTEDNNSYFISK